MDNKEHYWTPHENRRFSDKGVSSSSATRTGGRGTESAGTDPNVASLPQPRHDRHSGDGGEQPQLTWEAYNAARAERLRKEEAKQHARHNQRSRAHRGPGEDATPPQYPAGASRYHREEERMNRASAIASHDGQEYHEGEDMRSQMTWRGWNEVHAERLQREEAKQRSPHGNQRGTHRHGSTHEDVSSPPMKEPYEEDAYDSRPNREADLSSPSAKRRYTPGPQPGAYAVGTESAAEPQITEMSSPPVEERPNAPSQPGRRDTTRTTHYYATGTEPGSRSVDRAPIVESTSGWPSPVQRLEHMEAPLEQKEYEVDSPSPSEDVAPELIVAAEVHDDDIEGRVREQVHQELTHMLGKTTLATNVISMDQEKGNSQDNEMPMDGPGGQDPALRRKRKRTGIILVVSILVLIAVGIGVAVPLVLSSGPDKPDPPTSPPSTIPPTMSLPSSPPSTIPPTSSPPSTSSAAYYYVEWFSTFQATGRTSDCEPGMIAVCLAGGKIEYVNSTVNAECFVLETEDGDRGIACSAAPITDFDDFWGLVYNCSGSTELSRATRVLSTPDDCSSNGAVETTVLLGQRCPPYFEDDFDQIQCDDPSRPGILTNGIPVCNVTVSDCPFDDPNCGVGATIPAGSVCPE